MSVPEYSPADRVSSNRKRRPTQAGQLLRVSVPLPIGIPQRRQNLPRMSGRLRQQEKHR